MFHANKNAVLCSDMIRISFTIVEIITLVHKNANFVAISAKRQSQMDMKPINVEERDVSSFASCVIRLNVVVMIMPMMIKPK